MLKSSSQLAVQKHLLKGGWWIYIKLTVTLGYRITQNSVPLLWRERLLLILPKMPQCWAVINGGRDTLGGHHSSHCHQHSHHNHHDHHPQRNTLMCSWYRNIPLKLYIFKDCTVKLLVNYTSRKATCQKVENKKLKTHDSHFMCSLLASFHAKLLGLKILMINFVTFSHLTLRIVFFFHVAEKSFMIYL